MKYSNSQLSRSLSLSDPDTMQSPPHYDLIRTLHDQRQTKIRETMHDPFIEANVFTKSLLHDK